MQDERARALIDWIHEARLYGEKAGLDNMHALCDALGHPEQAVKCVHVAGTNGKGSVCALLESALRACGLTTGLYTSPYLMAYNERMRLMGEPVSDEWLIECGERVRQAAASLAPRGVRPTSFELGTALAFTLFEKKGVDVAVIETGLGGRIDPTNVIVPEVSVIATIGMDHMEVLGDSLDKIAREKAGILKPGVPFALYPQAPEAYKVFEEAVSERGAPMRPAWRHPMREVRLTAFGGSFAIDLDALGTIEARIALPGAHQLENARLALTALDVLKERGFPLDARSVEAGLRSARWPGRLEWLDGALLDGAHNPEGAKALVAYLAQNFPDRKIVLLTGMMRDKQPEICAELLSPVCGAVIATQVDWPRALPAEDLAALYAQRGIDVRAIPDIAQALSSARARAGTNALLVVAGSLYLVGAVRGRMI